MYLGAVFLHNAWALHPVLAGGVTLLVQSRGGVICISVRACKQDLRPIICPLIKCIAALASVLLQRGTEREIETAVRGGLISNFTTTSKLLFVATSSRVLLKRDIQAHTHGCWGKSGGTTDVRWGGGAADAD